MAITTEPCSTLTPEQQQVAAGAAWLDGAFPGWVGFVDLAMLDMANGCRCILGQLGASLFPNECRSLDDPFPRSSRLQTGFTHILNGFGNPGKQGQRFEVEHGFCCRVDSDWESLEEAWIDYITAHR